MRFGDAFEEKKNEEDFLTQRIFYATICALNASEYMKYLFLNFNEALI